MEANVIANYYLTDTIGDTIAGAIDSAIVALHDTGTALSHDQLAQLAGLQYQAGDTSGALSAVSIKSEELRGKSTVIDISNQSSGIYLYRVTSEDGKLVGEGKFIIEK